jgi:hypothetical protein
MPTTQATCADLIIANKVSREQDIRVMFSAENHEGLCELPLSIDTTQLTTVTLSWGGPADFLEIEHDKDGDIIKVVYVYQDWFDDARTTITEGPLWKYAQFIIEGLN